MPGLEEWLPGRGGVTNIFKNGLSGARSAPAWTILFARFALLLSSDLFQKLLFVQHRHAQVLCLIQLAARSFAGDHE